VANTWRSLGGCIYSNWLAYLCAQKGIRPEITFELVCVPEPSDLVGQLVNAQTAG
jgi:hypothetical protein